MPLSDWQVNLPNQHPGYITWEEYLANQQRLVLNQTQGGSGASGSAAREGPALLQGLLVCGQCGRRLSPHYIGQGSSIVWYECNWRRRELAGKSCWSVRGDLLDESIAQRILSALVPAQVEIALSALAEVEQRDQALEHQWQLKIQRAEYEGQLAQRRFEEVDPANRLVAATLEQRWEHALEELERLRLQYRQYQEKQTPPLSPEQQTQYGCWRMTCRGSGERQPRPPRIASAFYGCCSKISPWRSSWRPTKLSCICAGREVPSKTSRSNCPLKPPIAGAIRKPS